MREVAFGTFIVLQSILVLLDVWELRRRGAESKTQRRLPKRAFLFLLGVTCIFFGIQWFGAWLVPQPTDILAASQQVAGRYSPGSPQSLPVWSAFVLGIAMFYLAGLWDYLVHRFLSHSRGLWMTHEYHHLPNQVSILMPGILVRPFAFLPIALSTLATAATLYTMLLILGLPAWDLQPLLPALMLIVLVLTASHSVFLRRWPFVHRVLSLAMLTTPQEHLLHHGVDSHCNYGNFTTVWDRLFGTYADPTRVDLEQVPLGLSYDQDFLGTITFGKWRLSPQVRSRYEVDRFCNLHRDRSAP